MRLTHNICWLSYSANTMPADALVTLGARTSAVMVLTLKATFAYARSGWGAETGGFWHSRSATVGMFTYTQMQADLPFLEDKDGLGRAVSKRTRKIGCWTHLLRRGFCFRSATAHVWTHVMICVEANFPPASARVRSAHVWTYLKAGKFHLQHQKS